jgi:hypothetical protein
MIGKDLGRGLPLRQVYSGACVELGKLQPQRLCRVTVSAPLIRELGSDAALDGKPYDQHSLLRSCET